MLASNEINPNQLGEKILRLRGNPDAPPNASIVAPVNAQEDLDNALRLASDIAAYSGKFCFEIVLVINNYPADAPPSEIKTFGELGLKIVSIPNLRRPGEAPGFTARIPGLRAAASENAILFDSDCRIPNATALLNWYTEQLMNGAQLAYTHVDHFDLLPDLTVQIRVFLHYLTRWIKRAILRIPTNRGSNYAVNRSTTLQLYDQGMLADEMNVGPAIKATGGRVVYSGAKNLVVLTSGRKITGGWGKLAKYLKYRLSYNLRVLPVRANAAQYTKRR